MYEGFQGGPQLRPHDAERRQSLGQLYVRLVFFALIKLYLALVLPRFPLLRKSRRAYTQRNLIKSNRNQIVFVISRLI